jgi:hypothetical protein
MMIEECLDALNIVGWAILPLSSRVMRKPLARPLSFVKPTQSLLGAAPGHGNWASAVSLNLLAVFIT